VKKGTLLFTIEPALYELKVEAAKSSVTAAQAKLTQAEAEFKRQAELIAKHSTPQSEYDRRSRNVFQRKPTCSQHKRTKRRPRSISAT
jgi:multidrug resistance efflux pump